MTFPNPAGYYLPMPEQFEREVESLPLQKLQRLNLDVSESISCLFELEEDQTSEGFTFYFYGVSRDFDFWASSLPIGKLIDLQRWITELMAAIHLKES